MGEIERHTVREAVVEIERHTVRDTVVEIERHTVRDTYERDSGRDSARHSERHIEAPEKPASKNRWAKKSPVWVMRVVSNRIARSTVGTFEASALPALRCSL